MFYIAYLYHWAMWWYYEYQIRRELHKFPPRVRLGVEMWMKQPDFKAQIERLRLRVQQTKDSNERERE